jgi:protein SCO1
MTFPIDFPGRRKALLRTVQFAGLVASAGALGALAGCTEPQKFSSIDITGAEYARDFTLADHNGQQRSLKDFDGKVVVVFFGFTQCPDVCPTSLAELAEVRRKLGADGNRVQGLFISLDPERDTPPVLKAYMGNFDASFLALIPTLEQLPALAKEFKIFYKKVDGTTPSSYTLDHSAANFVYDTRGRVRLYSRYGMGVDALTADVAALLKSA